MKYKMEDVQNIVLDHVAGGYAQVSMYDPDIGLTVQDPVTGEYRLCVTFPGSPNWEGCWTFSQDGSLERAYAEGVLRMFIRREVFNTSPLRAIVKKQDRLPDAAMYGMPSHKTCPFQ